MPITIWAFQYFKGQTGSWKLYIPVRRMYVALLRARGYFNNNGFAMELVLKMFDATLTQLGMDEQRNHHTPGMTAQSKDDASS